MNEFQRRRRPIFSVPVISASLPKKPASQNSITQIDDNIIPQINSDLHNIFPLTQINPTKEFIEKIELIYSALGSISNSYKNLQHEVVLYVRASHTNTY